jgi:two-component system response regulator AtoC
MMPRVLVVDDEVGIQESLRMLLKGDCEVAVAGDVEAALHSITREVPDLILLDLLMPGRSGLELLKELSEHGLRTPVIVLTATKTVDIAVQAMKRGAVDFITKPFELEALRLKVKQILKQSALEQEVVRLRDQVDQRQRLGGLIGRSPAMQELFRAVERIARSKASVLLSGESGTGKELVARAIHDLGPRANGPFIAVNCAAIPHTLIESELFGHEKGAFTDAVDRRVGRFEAASGGTLLLDEIGELAPAVQVKLLRALQERRIERLGSSRPIDVDARIVAATNRDLEKDVDAGRFRADLFYRINVVPVRLPPLRERREDIRLLADSFVAQSESRGGAERSLSPEAVRALETYAWPGNVRELENAVEHGITLCEGELIQLDDLPESIAHCGKTEGLREEWRSGQISFEEALAGFEREMLCEALERRDWNQTRAAADLRITRRLLKLKMDRFEIRIPSSGREQSEEQLG